MFGAAVGWPAWTLRGCEETVVGARQRDVSGYDLSPCGVARACYELFPRKFRLGMDHEAQRSVLRVTLGVESHSNVWLEIHRR